MSYHWYSIDIKTGEVKIWPDEAIYPPNSYTPSSQMKGKWLKSSPAYGNAKYVNESEVPKLILMAHLIGA